MASFMRYGIFADVHSNLEALDAVVAAYKKESIDVYLCVGDVVGYGANPKECIEKVRSLAMVTVAGNHDWAAVNLFSAETFNPFAKTAILWTKQQLSDTDKDFLETLKLVYKNECLTLVHGTLDNPRDFDYMADGYIAEESFRRTETSVCFIGHSHIAGTFIKEDNDRISYRLDSSFGIKPEHKYIVNVGSVGQPRDANPKAAYCIFDTEKKEVQIRRVEYDTKSARRKIIDAGLPAFLGDRLLLGK
jgi:predicted phosphodiesterase